MADKKTPIIIKKKGGGHAAAHGGSWKVAYADFVTAMMAFFLLMWLVNMTPQTKKVQLADYFQQFSILDPGGMAVMRGDYKGQVLQAPEQGGEKAPELPPENPIPAESMKDQVTPGEKPGFAQPRPTGKAPVPSDVTAEQGHPGKEQIEQALGRAIDQRLKDFKEQVFVNATDNGVQIQVVDSQGRPLFQKGSIELTDVGKKALAAVTETIKNLPNKIAIEGHTDAYTFVSARYTNWELSTSRASTARREMESLGLNSDKLVRVAGYAATKPFVADAPFDPQNRRISILIFDTPAAVEPSSIKKDMTLPTPTPQPAPIQKNDLEQNGTDIHGSFRAPLQRP